MPSKKDAVGQRPVAVIVSLGISLGVSLGVTSFTYLTGSLQHLERKFSDFVARALSSEPSKTNVVIVGLTEKDIETLGFPVTDELLAELINKIDQQNPRVIGLDLHRNVNIGEKGKEELAEIYAQNQKLIGVEKTNRGDRNQDSISAPIQLELAGRAGASEVIKDPDNIVRRAYIYTKQAELGKTEVRDVLSFGLALAYKYLEGSNIYPEPSSQGWLKLNNTVFVSLDSADFFYPRDEIDNDQMLINYLFPEKSFEKVSFLDVLEGKISSSLMTEKIVLIGATAETLGDTYLTPYPLNMPRESNEPTNVVYGVEIHGIITHQIVAAALDEQKIISFPNPPFQYLWTVIWLVSIPAISSYFCSLAPPNRQEIVCILMGVSSSVIVILAGFGFFLAGWVFPTITPLLFVVSYLFVTYGLIRFNQLSQEKILLEEKVKETNQALEEAQKKILEQEKLKVHGRVIYRIAHEINNKINSIQLGLENSQDELNKIKLFVENNSYWFEEQESQNSIPQVVKILDEDLAEIIELNEKVVDIIDNIYQRQRRGRLYTKKEPVNINKVLNQLISESLKINQEKIVGFEVIVEKNYEQDILEINCIIPEIERALEKIIDNAVYQVIKKSEDEQYIDYQPKITLTTIKQPNLVLIKIKDNGTGIEPENLNKLFESFWSTKPSGEGMGLGLYIAKDIISEHGGNITVDSEPGAWAEFTITLPLEES